MTFTFTNVVDPILTQPRPMLAGTMSGFATRCNPVASTHARTFRQRTGSVSKLKNVLDCSRCCPALRHRIIPIVRLADAFELVAHPNYIVYFDQDASSCTVTVRAVVHVARQFPP